MEIYDEELKKFVKKHDKRRKTIQTAQIKAYFEKEELPYSRIHDGRHAYITLLLHGIEAERLKGNPPEDILIEYK